MCLFMGKNFLSGNRSEFGGCFLVIVRSFLRKVLFYIGVDAFVFYIFREEVEVVNKVGNF